MSRVQFRNGRVQFCNGVVAFDPNVCCESCVSCALCYHAACDPCRGISEVTIELLDVAEPNTSGGNAYCSPPVVSCDCDSLNSAYVLSVPTSEDGNICVTTWETTINNPCGDNLRDSSGTCLGGDVTVGTITIRARIAINNLTRNYTADTLGSVPAVGDFWFLDNFTLPTGHFIAFTISYNPGGFPLQFLYLYSFDNDDGGLYKCDLMSGGSAPIIACNGRDPFCEFGTCTPGGIFDQSTKFCDLRSSSILVSTPMFLAPGGTC